MKTLPLAFCTLVLAACSSSGAGGGGGPDGGGAVGGGGGAVGGGGGSGAAGGGGGGGSGAVGGGGGGPGACPPQAIPPALSGGCAPQIVTPAPCEIVDLSGGKSYEVAWTTNGTGCETPWKLCAAGSPVSDPNSLCVNLSEDVSAGISKTGGVLNVTAADLAGLSSDTGWYHVMVGSYYGSHNGTVAFYLQK